MKSPISIAKQALYIGFVWVAGVSSVDVSRGEMSECPAATVRVSFSNVPEDFSVDEARRLVGAVRERFVEMVGAPIELVPTQVCFVEHLQGGEMMKGSSGQMQGVTLHGTGCAVIQISIQRSSSWQRVLAHEMSHVLVRQAFGKVSNRVLSEGLAEYMAELQCPHEVRRDIRNAKFGATFCILQDYVEGYQFCKGYATSPGFGSFLGVAFQEASRSYDDLVELWDHVKATSIVVNRATAIENPPSNI